MAGGRPGFEVGVESLNGQLVVGRFVGERPVGLEKIVSNEPLQTLLHAQGLADSAHFAAEISTTGAVGEVMVHHLQRLLDGVVCGAGKRGGAIEESKRQRERADLLPHPTHRGLDPHHLECRRAVRMGLRKGASVPPLDMSDGTRNADGGRGTGDGRG